MLMQAKRQKIFENNALLRIFYNQYNGYRLFLVLIRDLHLSIISDLSIRNADAMLEAVVVIRPDGKDFTRCNLCD